MNNVKTHIKVIDNDSVKAPIERVDEYNEKMCVQRVLKEDDGSITIDATVFDTISIIYIATDDRIFMDDGNGCAFYIDNEFFLRSDFNKTFTLQRTGNDVNVSITIWGVRNSV